MRLLQSWTAQQRRVLIGLVALFLAFLACQLMLNPVYVSDPQPPEPARAAEVQDRIDPNISDWQTLAALPMIGAKRAQDMVAYREQFVAAHPGKLAFAKPNDMLEIRGIGPLTLAQIEPFLLFPEEQAPATRP